MKSLFKVLGLNLLVTFILVSIDAPVALTAIPYFTILLTSFWIVVTFINSVLQVAAKIVGSKQS